MSEHGTSSQGAEGPIVRGYFSEVDKRRFTIATGILGGLFFVAQFALPFVIFMIEMPALFLPGSTWMREAEPSRGAKWKGRIYYPERHIRPGQSGDAATLCAIDPGSEGKPTCFPELPGEKPWLLAGSDRLWIVSRNALGSYRNGRFTVEAETAPLGRFGRPFWVDGRPALVKREPGGASMMVLGAAGWESTRLHVPNALDPESQLQILPAAGGFHVFLSQGSTVYYRFGLPTVPEESTTRWQPIADVCCHWSAALLQGSPVVIAQQTARPDSPLEGFRHQRGEWKRFLSLNTRLVSDFGIFPGAQPDEWLILVQGFPGSLKLFELDGARLVRTTRYGSGFPFPRSMFLITLAPWLLNLLLPLVLALIQTQLMRKHRIHRFESERASAPFASLWRRALAQAVDRLILAAPLAVMGYVFLRPLFDLEDSVPLPSDIFKLFGWMLGGFGWIVAGMGIYSVTEGVWGASPGKWLVGIRVLGTDLKPCGIGRALLRNLLKFVDGFFNFMVGILVIALSEHWQRIGDMASRTIVIDLRSRTAT